MSLAVKRVVTVSVNILYLERETNYPAVKDDRCLHAVTGTLGFVQ